MDLYLDYCRSSYLAAKYRPNIELFVHNCEQFINNNKASHEGDMRLILCCLRDNYGGGYFIPPNKVLVYCYIGVNFSGPVNIRNHMTQYLQRV